MKKSRVILLVAIAIVVMIGIGTSIFLSNGNEKNESLNFKLNEDGESYSVVGLGTYSSADVVIPNTYNNLPVTSIGNEAFGNCTSLRSVTIPDSVTSIGALAFANCTQLTSVTIGNSVTIIGSYAFFHCTSLTSVKIGNSLMSIGSSAFSDCYSLTSINIPDTVTNIGHGAFSFCDSLKYNEYDNAYYMGNENNPYVVLIKTKKTNITSCEIHNSTKFISADAFYNCYSLTSIVIPDSVTSINDRVFYECNSLISVTIGNSVTSIGERAFYNCTSLKAVCNKSSLNITMGSTNNGYVGYYAKHIVTDESQTALKYVGDYLFYDDGSEVYLLKYLGDETNIALPEYDGGKEYGIYKRAFYGDNRIISVTIPNSVTSIGDEAFGHCTSLTSIIIPASVTSVKGYVFEYCSSLTIYCEAYSKPKGWNSAWKKDFDGRVVWGYTEN